MSPISTSNSERGRPLRFGLRALLFAAPILLLIGALELCLWRTGDLMGLEATVALQLEQGDLLVGSGYHGDDGQYQRAMLTRKRAQILVLGSSRVLQIRDLMFHPLEARFYNAGRTVTDLGDFTDMIDRFEAEPAQRPQVIILGIDPGWLREPGPMRPAPPNRNFRLWRPGDHAAVIRTFCFGARGDLPVAALKRGAGGASPYYGYPAIGNLALGMGTGYRWDGSRQYDPAILRAAMERPGYVDREQPPIIDRVRNGLPPFDQGDLRSGFRTELTHAIGRLKDMEIELLVILPPFSDEVRTAIEAMPTWQPLWRRYLGDLPRLLDQMAVPCLDLTDHRRLGLSDPFMYDGIHPSEVYMAHAVHALLALADDDSLLSQVDVRALEARLDDPAVIPLSLAPPIWEE